MLAINNYVCYNNKAKEIRYRGIEQLVARRAHNPEVVGSSPSPATIKKTLRSSRFQGFFLLFMSFLGFSSLDDLVLFNPF